LFNRSTFANLENTSCSIKDKCTTGHAPWPKGNCLFKMKDRLTRICIGICTKCQPNPVTLMRQVIMQSDEINDVIFIICFSHIVMWIILCSRMEIWSIDF
jgi:hypothetical protein